MDNEISNVGAQYIICECGDNFPNEKFLNKHLANGHGEVETFQCDVCPEMFTSSNSLSRHMYTHQAEQSETVQKPDLKTYSRKTLLKEVQKDEKIPLMEVQKEEKILLMEVQKDEKIPLMEVQKEEKKLLMEVQKEEKKPLKEVQKGENKPLKEVKKEVKKPPVIKLKNLTRIDSISLLQNLKAFGRFMKIEPQAETPEPQPDPQPDPKPEPEPEQSVMEEQGEEVQVIVKNETQETAEETEEIYYQCDVCNSIFYTEWDFNVHYQSAHALKLEPSASAEQVLARHLATDHADHEGVQAEADTAYYYECELCHKIFASEKYFNIHYVKAHGQLPAIAEAADEQETIELTPEPETEPKPEPVVEEVKPKAPEQVIYYKCDLCKILYPSEKAYNLHFDKKHGGQSCQDLQTGFRFIEQELTEDFSCSPPPLEEFTCEFCPKTFTMKRSLQVHRKRMHMTELRLTEQVREPARPASRSKVCDVCGRAYNSNAALRYHQRRHTGEKPYACTICPKRFTMPMFLQIHTRTHTGEKPYECPHCPKAFTNKAALIRHDRIHTGARPFKCGTCSKGFISKAMLNRHVRVHTGVKPYACPECGKFFTQSNSMKLHVSTVHLKLPAPYKSRSRRNKSEARALQLALKGLPAEELVLGD